MPSGPGAGGEERCVGLIFYFTQLPVPDAMLKPMTHLGNMTTPLSMIVTGMNLSNRKLSVLLLTFTDLPSAT